MRLLVTIMTALTLVLTACGGTDIADPADVAAPDTSTTAPEGDASPEPVDDAGEEPGDTATPDEPAEEPADGAAPEGPAQEPAGDEDADGAVAAGDCAAAGLGDTVQDEGPSREAAATAAFLLDAAVRCDEQLLFTAAHESDTSFFFGSATVDEVFALPEEPDTDPGAWEALARLLGSTTAVSGDSDIWTWPAASAPDAGDGAWQELVDSGLYTQADVDELRSAGDGYLGWRVGIDADGSWRFLTAGD